MYSRYKIRVPSPPPDYAGTTFPSDPALPSDASMPEKVIGNDSCQPTVGLQDSADIPNAAEAFPGFSEAPPESGELQSRDPQEIQTAVPVEQKEADQPESAVSCTIPLIGDGSTDDTRYNPISDRIKQLSELLRPPTVSERTDMEDILTKDSTQSDPFDLLAELDLDDWLFMGAMLFLMSGKAGDDSFLLISYLLTCGL